MKRTKYGTPPPKRPAPPPPQKPKASNSKELVAPIPKPRNSPVKKPLLPPIPKPRSNSVHLSESNQSPTATSSKSEHQVTETDKKEKYVVYPEYEDLDGKDDDDYVILDHISQSEDAEEPSATIIRDLPNSDGEIPPELPPKNESKATKRKKELPPLPPRTQRGAKITKRHYLSQTRSTSKERRLEERKDEDDRQDSGPYEPLDCSDFSDASQGLSLIVLILSSYMYASLVIALYPDFSAVNVSQGIIYQLWA